MQPIGGVSHASKKHRYEVRTTVWPVQAVMDDSDPKTLFVDVRLEDGSDASMHVKRKAEELGARYGKLN